MQSIFHKSTGKSLALVRFIPTSGFDTPSACGGVVHYSNDEKDDLQVTPEFSGKDSNSNQEVPSVVRNFPLAGASALRGGEKRNHGRRICFYHAGSLQNIWRQICF